MKIIDVKQGTEEWMKARVGMPTSSNFDKIVTSTGAKSKQAKKYLYTLAGERIIGKKEESYQNATMVRGIEMEPEARACYSLIKGVDVKEVGLCLSDKKEYGCSPDGLVGKDGGLEIKCPLLYTSVEYLLDGGLARDYYQQVQGCMLVTGRKWWDIMAYYPGMKPLIIRVERADVFLSSLKLELKSFCAELKAITEKIK